MPRSQNLIREYDRFFNDAIEVNPNRCGGSPTVKGTRFTIAQLLAELAEGQSYKEIAKNFNIDSTSIQNALNALAIQFDKRSTD